MSSGVSSPFLVSNPTNGPDGNPSTTALADGGFLVTWQGVNPASNTLEIYAQRYGAPGPGGTSAKIGPIFQISSATNGSDTSPSVTALADGSFVVSWGTYDVEGRRTGFLGQRFGAPDPDGISTELSPVFPLSNGVDTPPEYLINVVLTPLADGSFLVSETQYDPEEGYIRTSAQRYSGPDANGGLSPSGSVFEIIPGDRNERDITPLPDGGFLAIYTMHDPNDIGPRGSLSTGIFAQRFGPAGVDGISPKVGDIFQISSSSNGSDFAASATGLTDGGVLVTWSGHNPATGGTDGNDVLAQRFSAPGPDGGLAPVGGIFPVGSKAAGGSSAAALPDGGFLVSWTGNPFEVLAQRFGAPGPDGVSPRVGPARLVSSATNGSDSGSSVTVLANGRVLISWTGRDPGSTDTEVLARQFGAEDTVTPLLSGRPVTFVSGTGAGETFTGDARNNYLNGQGGQDTASGGLGDDTYVVDTPSDVVVEKPAEGTDTVESWATSYVLSAHVENLVLKGSGQTGTGNGLANRITGSKGADIINGKAGHDWLTGQAGADTFVVERGSGHDVITDFQVGPNGQDIVRLVGSSFTSFDQIRASMVQVGSDVVLGLPDGSSLTFLNRTISQFAPEDFGYLPLSGQPVTFVSGTGGNETFTGDARNNYLNGQGGQDTASGGLGDDTYVVDIPSDVVVEKAGEGVDTVESWATPYVLSANVENLVLKGSGQTGTGNGLANRITGGSGADIINGKGGHDWLTGQAGGDTFVVERGSGHDVITDFEVGPAGQDVVQLVGSSLTSSDQIKAAMTQVRSDVLLSLPDGSTLTFLNRTIGQFTSDDFGDAPPGPPLITKLVSISSTGEQGNSHVGHHSSISADGRYVAYSSSAHNLVEGDTNRTTDIFVYDREALTAERVSISSTAQEGNNNSLEFSLSGSGRYVAFASNASNLVAGDTNAVVDVFVHDRVTDTTERVSVSSTGQQGNGDSSRFSTSVISADGRYVTFASEASNLVAGDTNGHADIFVHDRVTDTTERVPVSSDDFSLSADGRYVAYSSSASNLVAGDTNGVSDIFVYDRVTDTTERISVSSTGQQGDDDSASPSISADGSYVAFTSRSSTLVEGDTNGREDIFLYDRVTDTTERISVGPMGEQGNDSSLSPAISGNGQYVAYASIASNLVPGDSNGYADVFVTSTQDFLLL